MKSESKKPAKKKPGRPTKKTDQYIDPLLDNLRAGMSYQAAASQAGLSVKTVEAWRHDDPDFAELFDAAVDFAEAVLLNEIRQQGRSRDDWRASAWILERRFPERWALRKEIDMSVNKKGDGQDMVAAMIEQAVDAMTAGDTIDDQESNEDE